MKYSREEWKEGPNAEGTIGVWLGPGHWVGWDIEGTCEECFGNLQLIQAAPKLFEAAILAYNALVYVVSTDAYSRDEFRTVFEKLEQALSIATGDSVEEIRGE